MRMTWAIEDAETLVIASLLAALTTGAFFRNLWHRIMLLPQLVNSGSVNQRIGFHNGFCQKGKRSSPFAPASGAPGFLCSRRTMLSRRSRSEE